MSLHLRISYSPNLIRLYRLFSYKITILIFSILGGIAWVYMNILFSKVLNFVNGISYYSGCFSNSVFLFPSFLLHLLVFNLVILLLIYTLFHSQQQLISMLNLLYGFASRILFKLFCVWFLLFQKCVICLYPKINPYLFFMSSHIRKSIVKGSSDLDRPSIHVCAKTKIHVYQNAYKEKCI